MKWRESLARVEQNQQFTFMVADGSENVSGSLKWFKQNSVDAACTIVTDNSRSVEEV